MRQSIVKIDPEDYEWRAVFCRDACAYLEPE